MSIAALTTFPVATERSALGRMLHLQCVVCGQPWPSATTSKGASNGCPRCGFRILKENGIFRCLAPDRAVHFQRFIQDYELVRSSEGRGSASPDYYLRLPFKDLTGRNAWQWSIRAKTWHHLEKHILRGLAASYPNGCDIVDIGAGNGWASFHLSLRGHRPVAVDLLDNDADGLGAARHFCNHLPRPFPRFQAEMDRLPFAQDQFDVAIFNASFHYAVDYERTLREVLRCLRRPGHIIILDSPFYYRDESGQRMLEEKHSAFQRRFGFRSDSIRSQEFLTGEILEALGAKLSLQWKTFKPWYGWNWALRPFKARLLRRREPSKFYLIWTEVQR